MCRRLAPRAAPLLCSLRLEWPPSRAPEDMLRCTALRRLLPPLPEPRPSACRSHRAPGSPQQQNAEVYVAAGSGPRATATDQVQVPCSDPTPKCKYPAPTLAREALRRGEQRWAGTGLNCGAMQVIKDRQAEGKVRSFHVRTGSASVGAVMATQAGGEGTTRHLPSGGAPQLAPAPSVKQHRRPPDAEVTESSGARYPLHRGMGAVATATRPRMHAPPSLLRGKSCGRRPLRAC